VRCPGSALQNPPSLALAGRLEVISLCDVLQILGASRRTGRIQVERENPPERAAIELVEGKIVHTELAPSQQRLGAVLLRRQRLDPDDLGEALRRQSAAAPWKPLGAVLLEMGAVEPGDLAEGLAEQIEESVSVVLSWNEGVFRFRTGLGSEEPVRPSAGLSFGVALDAQQLLLEAARRWDESDASH